MKILELREKVWFRAVKIIYILLIILTIVISFIVLYDSKPNKVVKSYTYSELISMGAIPGIPTSTSDLSFASKVRPIEQPIMNGVYNYSWNYWIFKLLLTVAIIYVFNILITWSFLYIVCGAEELKFYIKSRVIKAIKWFK